MSCRHSAGVRADRMTSVRSCFSFLIFVFLSMYLPATAFAETAPRVPLSGHVLPALADAQPAKATAASGDPLSLTIVLRRTAAADFDRYLKDVYDASSAQYRNFLTPQGVSDRFGPSIDDYAIVRAYFVQQGFAVVEDSANRLTLTVRGARNLVESALHTRIGEYE